MADNHGIGLRIVLEANIGPMRLFVSSRTPRTLHDVVCWGTCPQLPPVDGEQRKVNVSM